MKLRLGRSVQLQKRGGFEAVTSEPWRCHASNSRCDDRTDAPGKTQPSFELDTASWLWTFSLQCRWKTQRQWSSSCVVRSRVYFLDSLQFSQADSSSHFRKPPMLLHSPEMLEESRAQNPASNPSIHSPYTPLSLHPSIEGTCVRRPPKFHLMDLS